MRLWVDRIRKRKEKWLPNSNNKMLHFDLYFQLIQQWTIASLISVRHLSSPCVHPLVGSILSRRNGIFIQQVPTHGGLRPQMKGGCIRRRERGRVLFLGRNTVHRPLNNKREALVLAGGTLYTHTQLEIFSHFIGTHQQRFKPILFFLNNSKNEQFLFKYSLLQALFTL